MPDEFDPSSGGDDFTHTDIHRWLVPTSQRPGDVSAEEKRMTLVYDAIWQTITFDSRTYHLANGNLFVIRYDQNWHPAGTQLNGTMNKTGSEEDINAFKSALKDYDIV